MPLAGVGLAMFHCSEGAWGSHMPFPVAVLGACGGAPTSAAGDDQETSPVIGTAVLAPCCTAAALVPLQGREGGHGGAAILS
jgi:hypothetical protein